MKNYIARNGTDAVVQEWDGDIIGPEHTQLWADYQAWLAEGNTPTPPSPDLLPVPQIISDRQFFQQAAIDGIITQQEALDAVKTGTIPAMLQNIVDSISDSMDKFNAQMLLSGATVFERNHPLVATIENSLNWNSEQVDQFFRNASKL
jgi:hypothetical protein